MACGRGPRAAFACRPLRQRATACFLAGQDDSLRSPTSGVASASVAPTPQFARGQAWRVPVISELHRRRRRVWHSSTGGVGASVITPPVDLSGCVESAGYSTGGDSLRACHLRAVRPSGRSAGADVAPDAAVVRQSSAQPASAASAASASTSGAGSPSGGVGADGLATPNCA